MVTNRTRWRVAEVCGQITQVGQRHRLSAGSFQSQTRAAVVHNHTVIRRNQIVEQVRPVRVRLRARQRRARSRTQACVQAHGCTRDAPFISVRNTVQIAVDVNEVTDEGLWRKAEVCGQCVIVRNRDRVAGCALHFLAVFEATADNTVVAIGYSLEQVRAVNVSRGRAHTVCERRQVSRTGSLIQINLHARHRHINTTKRAAHVIVDVGRITDCPNGREAEVSGQLNAARNHNGLTRCAFDGQARCRVGGNNTVVTIQQVREQVQTVGVGHRAVNPRW